MKRSPRHRKRALIIGVTGQDGAYLASFLRRKNHTVIGAAQSVSKDQCWRLKSLGMEKKVTLVKLDLKDTAAICRVLQKTRPDEIYNLAAQSSVATSFENPLETGDITGMAVLRLLEALRHLKKKVRLFQASSSEVLNLNKVSWGTKERKEFSPYAASKIFAHLMAAFYRKKFGIHVSCGILFNHESPLRPPSFVSQKIARGVVDIKRGLLSYLRLGQMDSYRDWGYAGDYVEAMWLMLQRKSPEDFVIATGEAHSVREFVEAAFSEVGIKIRWKGDGFNEKGYDSKTSRVRVVIDRKFYRSSREYQKGEISRTRKILHWKPRVKFKELVKLLVNEARRSRPA